MRRCRHMRTLSAAFGAVLLAGCNVGPDYERPDIALPDEFIEAPDVTDARSSGDLESLWLAFQEPELAGLITAARANNQTIAQAQATLAETRALSGLRVFSLFPTINAGGDVERTSESSEDPFGFGNNEIVERYRAGFDLSWEIDLFGSLRRAAESIVMRDQADTAALYAAELSVVAETAQAYFAWRGAVMRIAVLESNIANQAQNVSILDNALAAGRGTALDVARARSLERRIAAALPGARTRRTQAEQRLAVLTATSATEIRARLSEPNAMPVMPALVPVGTPADWLMRRPDVLAAERRLAEFTALIGVETAELYPKLTLLGSFGWTGAQRGAIGNDDAERWRFAPTLSWRFLDFGRVRQNISAAEARADAALANFEQTWRLAIEETENALATYRATTETVAVLEEAIASSNEASGLARLRYDNGADSFLSVLDAERTDLELQDELALARTDQATALAALYKALGGSFIAR